jgi:NAD-dependent dihydropyrimidine dehydrogenase PreA subunit
MASKPWHGVPKSEFSWYPTIDTATCKNCGLCLASCGNGVFGYSKSQKTYFVANGDACVVGCTTCGKVCPEVAILFPSDPEKFVKDAVRKHRIFPEVTKELEARLEKYPDHVVKSR